MPQIIPIKELKNTAEISELCHKVDEPIYITKNGYGDMVIMSMEIYERTMKQIQFYHELEVSEQDIAEGVCAVQVLENLLQVYREDMKHCKESLAYALFEYASSCETLFIDSKNTAEKALWRDLVAYGVKTGEFNDVNPDVVMDTFLYSYRGVMMWGRVLSFEDETINHLIDAVKVMLVKDYK